MCGIAGILTTAGSSAAIEERVIRMVAAEHHRGPDDGGVHVASASAPLVVFGHRRLSIIDVSRAGHQPMVDEESGACLTYNGEIYNFREVRAELESLGHRFRTRTDTEVLLRACIEWGVECPARLRGIFAFGFWNPRSRTLLLARDQIGVKPLYFAEAGGTIVFASEVRSVLASGLVERRLDASGFRSYLEFGAVQDPFTLVAGVRSVLPGHVVETGPEGRRERRYWTLPAAEADTDVPIERIHEEVRAGLEDAVQSQMISDVPLGAFLSGGIDSTAIAAMMQRASARPVKTFSIIFEEPRYDEREFSRAAARHLGTEHTELLLRGEDVRGTLGTALAALDQPSTDGLNTYYVAGLTRRAGLTVALSGVGGDEVFGGYDGYSRALTAERAWRRTRPLPRWFRHGTAAVLDRVGTGRLRRAGDVFDCERLPYLLSRQLFSGRQIERMLSRHGSAGTTDEPPTFARLESETRGLDAINRMAALELQTYMLSTLLRDTDQMSMAHALEVRVPLLDHRLVEQIFRLPGRVKLEQGQPKPLLTRALGDALPAECVHRPKRGFELPFARWLRESLREEIRDSLMSGSPGGPFEPAALRALWHDFEGERVSWSRVWSVFVVQDWLRRHGVAA